MRFKCFSLFLPAFRDDNVVVFLQHTHTGWPQITTKSDDGFGHKVTLARVFGSDKNGALEVRLVTFFKIDSHSIKFQMHFLKTSRLNKKVSAFVSRKSIVFTLEMIYSGVRSAN